MLSLLSGPGARPSLPLLKLPLLRSNARHCGDLLTLSVTLDSRPTQINTHNVFSIPESSLVPFPHPQSLTDRCHVVLMVLDFYPLGSHHLCCFWLVSFNTKLVTVVWVGAFISDAQFTAKCSFTAGTRHGPPLPSRRGLWALPGPAIQNEAAGSTVLRAPGRTHVSFFCDPTKDLPICPRWANLPRRARKESVMC